MEFKIKPFHKNSYPRRGVFIKSPNAFAWLKEVYAMGLDPEDTFMYALAGKTANELFGCLVVPKDGTKITNAGKNTYMQCISERLFIPEHSVVFPELSDAEWAKQFTAPAYIMHQDIGLAELTEEIDWNHLLELPQPASAEITTPLKGVYIPNAIRSLSIEADEQALAESIENQAGKDATDVPFNMNKIMKGNQREIDKLLKYLEKHPEAALTLGIPLDIMGSSRGGGGAKFTFGKNTGMGGLNNPDSAIRSVLFILACIAVIILLGAILIGSANSKGPSILPIGLIILAGRFIYAFISNSGSSNTGSPGRAAIIANDKFTTLQNRYEQLAKDFIAKKEYQKAASVYLKLLKNNLRAAQVLEDGGYYGEAGAIYLKYCKDKAKAAQCFEKGKLYAQAIDIYKELNETEKVADLYTLLNQKEEAERYYTMVAEDCVQNKQYVKASLIYRKKMNQPLRAQALLLEGWHKKLDAHNCLNNYFANIQDVNTLVTEIERFYTTELEESRNDAFLQILKIEFSKHEVLRVPVKEIAYKIIAECIDTRPSMASDLMAFNPDDKSLSKDVMKFKASKIRI